MEEIREKSPNEIWLEELDQKPSELTFDDIYAWCEANGEDKLIWLLETSETKTTIKVYPRKTIINEDGSKSSVADKTKPQTEKETTYTLPMIRKEFIAKFMPELIKEPKETKPNMRTKLAALKKKLGR
jgi:hypothetical protein